MGVNQDSRVWVGGLPSRYNEDNIHDKFKEFGSIDSVRIIHGPKDSYCFVQFETERAAEDSIKELDQKEFDGRVVKVAMATKDGGGGGGGGKGGDRDRGGFRGGRDRYRSRSPYRWGGRDRSRDRGGFRDRGGGRDRYRDDYDYRGGKGGGRGGYDDRRGGRYRDDSRDRFRGGDRHRDEPLPRAKGKGRGRDRNKIEYKLELEGIPRDMTWNELKDLARGFGNSVCYATTYDRGGSQCGMVEFDLEDDMYDALKGLDNKRVHGEKSRLKVSVLKVDDRGRDDRR